jgi:hypothetical protein
VEFSYASLSGTQMNCSGGQMPWGSWITCEETINGYDVADDFTRGTKPPSTYEQNIRLQKTHGFIFEVPADGGATAEPITHAGRFPHESVAWDPKGGALYLSEDNFAFPSGFYKYVPPEDPMRAGRLLDGGRLYMLKVVGVNNADLAVHLADGTSFAVEWVEIDQPSFDFGRPGPGAAPTRTNDEGLQFVSSQGLAKGCRQVLPSRGHGLRPRLGLLHVHPGRSGTGADSAGHGRRLRQGLGSNLGLRPQQRDPAHAVRVAEPGRARLPRQRDHQRPRDPHRV